MESEKKDILEKEDAQEESKKRYSTPQLVVHGNVEKITAHVGVGQRDALHGS